MIAVAPWKEHFSQIEVDEIRPLFDSADPIEHYRLVRDSLFMGAHRFEAALRAPIGRHFPPTVLLRSLVLKSHMPLILEWPNGIMPGLAIQCQLALLLAMQGENELAEKLAEKLAPLVLGGFWTLWTLEREYNEEETKLSCALFLQAIGRPEEADRLYSPELPNTPFFYFLYKAGIQIKISPTISTDLIAWTLNGSKAGMGAAQLGTARILAFGPHGHPLSNAHLFGICEAGTEWCCAAAQKDVWFQVEPSSSGFSLHTLGVVFEKPIALVFYVKANECQIEGKVFKPKSLQRFVGEASTVHFEGSSIAIDRPLKIELIPLAGNQSFWGADFLVAFWLSPLSSKISFTIIN